MSEKLVINYKGVNITLENTDKSSQAGFVINSQQLVNYLTAVIDDCQKLCKKPDLPESWCDLWRINGCFIAADSEIKPLPGGSIPVARFHENVWPNKELAEAALAMSQLAQLRERYWDGWEPDWEDDDQMKFIIHIDGHCIATEEFTTGYNFFLVFPTASQRNHFLKHHTELIETAKPLL